MSFELGYFLCMMLLLIILILYKTRHKHTWVYVSNLPYDNEGRRVTIERCSYCNKERVIIK